MYEAHERGARAAGRPLEHLLIAIRVPKRENRATADVLLDGDRLAGSVVDELELRLARERRPAVFLDAELRHERGADDLLRWDAVHTFTPSAYELHRSA